MTCSGFNGTGNRPGQDFLRGVISMGEVDKRQSVHYNSNHWIPTPTAGLECVLTRSTIPCQVILGFSDILQPLN